MQVAGLGAYHAAHAPDKRDEGGLASKMLREQAAQSAEISASFASINILQVVQQYEISFREEKEISPYGLLALDYIINSTRLSKEDKRALIKLVAIVDEFAGGDPKLMRDIIGIAKIMEMNAKEPSKPMPIREALEIYFEEREKLDPSKEITITVESEMNAFSMQYFGMTATEVLSTQASATEKPTVNMNA